MSTTPWILDTPALVAWDHGKQRAVSGLRFASDTGFRLAVPAACVAEWLIWHQPSPTSVSALLEYPAVDVVPLDRHGATLPGELGASRLAVIDETEHSGVIAALHAASLAIELDAPLVTDAVSGAQAYLPAKHVVLHWA
jgi:hypothetical protein